MSLTRTFSLSDRQAFAQTLLDMYPALPKNSSLVPMEEMISVMEDDDGLVLDTTPTIYTKPDILALKEEYFNPQAEKEGYELLVAAISADPETFVTTVLDSLHTPHPLITQDRELGLKQVDEIVAAAEEVIANFKKEWLDGPACPYQQTILEYLGPNFKCPTIHELKFPVGFTAEKALTATKAISNAHADLLFSRIDLMSAEAADMAFPGITSENIGHAFSVLSATKDGPKYVIDSKKMAKHLEFNEIWRNIPVEYIIENPLVVAYKMINRYIEINQ